MSFNLPLLFDLTFILMHRDIFHLKWVCTANIQLLHFRLALLQEMQGISCVCTYVLCLK